MVTNCAISLEALKACTTRAWPWWGTPQEWVHVGCQNGGGSTTSWLSPHSLHIWRLVSTKDWADPNHFCFTLLLCGPLTPSLTDNCPWKWISECEQVLQVAKWEGSVALVHTHYDPALWVRKTMMDAFLWPLQLGSTVQHTTSTWWGAVCAYPWGCRWPGSMSDDW